MGRRHILVPYLALVASVARAAQDGARRSGVAHPARGRRRHLSPRTKPEVLFCHRQQRSRPCLEAPRGNAFTKRVISPEQSVILFADADSTGEGSSEQDGEDALMFLQLMSPMDSVKPDQMSASSLAYLGDVLFELFIRSRYVWPNRRMSDLQNKVVSIVRAEYQSTLLQKLIASFGLNPAEQSVLARGRNANLTARKKVKGGQAAAYQDSTALEALLGYMYICDKQRFNEMLNWIRSELDDLDSA